MILRIKNLLFFNLINLNEFNLNKIEIKILNCNLEYKKKINKFPKKEKDIFWLGFDDNFKEVPRNKIYEKDNWYFKKNKI